MSRVLDYLWHLLDAAITACLDWQPVPVAVH
jgi:hypothetical protein